MKRYIEHLIHGAERRSEQFMRHQVTQPGQRMTGGLRGDIFEAKPTIYAMADLAAVYLNKDSCY